MCTIGVKIGKAVPNIDIKISHW